MENEQIKSDSLWWNNHTSPEISKLVAEDVKEVDQSVKEMLELIELEHNGEFSVELIAHIKEFSLRYHLLAERYSGLTGELHKYVESGTKIQNNEAKVFGSQQSPSTLTPDKKLGTREFVGGDFTYNLSVSSGRVASDISLGESSRFVLLSADSDSESCNSSPNDHITSIPTRKVLKHANLNIENELSRTDGVVDLTKHDLPNVSQRAVDSERYEEMLKRISTSEEQLWISNRKLGFQEEEIARMKSVQRDNASLLEQLNSMKFLFESAKDEIEMYEVHTETEKRKVSQLKAQITALGAQLESEKSQVVYLQESTIKSNADVAERDYEIKKLTSALHNASENFASEKAQLESHISNLSKRLSTQEARTDEWELLCESLAKEIKQCEANKKELKQMQEAQVSWQDEIESMTLDLYEKNECVKMMDKDLERLKLESDALRAEKDELTAKLQTLGEELSSREKQVLETERRLHELHSERVQLSEGSENANKEIGELRSRVEELEEEVERQAQEARTDEWELQCESLAKEIKQCEANKKALKQMQEAQVSWQDGIESMTLDLYEKNECVKMTNKDLHRMKLENDALRAEKDELTAKLQTLGEELSSREKQVLETERRLHELHSESVQLSEGSENANKEIGELRSRVEELEEEVERQAQEARTDEWELQCESLAKEIKQCEANKKALKQMQEAQVSWQDEIESMTLDLYEKNECVKMTNKDLHRMKLENDALRAEKDELTAKLQTLGEELSSREKQVLETESRLHELHFESVQLSEGSESANKEIGELRSRVEELEEEVERQRVLFSERDDEKREAKNEFGVATVDLFGGASNLYIIVLVFFVFCFFFF